MDISIINDNLDDLYEELEISSCILNIREGKSKNGPSDACQIYM